MGSFKLSRWRPILDWVPAALSVVMIALESTATMSAQNTSEWLYPVWVRIFGPISAPHWAEVHHLIRKTGHFVGYGTVSLAFFYSWRQTLQRMTVRHWTLWRRSSVLAVVCTLLVAIADEYHQSFLPSRTSSPLDVCLDLCGAIFAQLLLLLMIQLFSRSPKFRAA
jgi:VanZ family protein